MERLPDSNYVEKTLEGVEPKSGIKQPGFVFNQGEDVLLSFYLTYEGQPVTFNDWHLEAYIKKSTHAANVLWKGVPDLGIFKKEKDGYFYILMPSSASSYFLPGTYYLDVKGCQRLGRSGEAFDLTRTLLSATFNIRLTASSPHPTLKPIASTEVQFDPQTREVTITRTSVELTQPPGVDITAI